MATKGTTFERIWHVVRAIPRGRATTYGDVARRAGLPRGARTVGRAMAACPTALPWHRVVGLVRPGVGRVTIRDPLVAGLQRALLRGEGVKVSRTGDIELRDSARARGRRTR